ncbi:hypothetical protein [Ornithinimicrobium sediminis]|uniref:hypothetical protein n=1 Tax=Ornithinimicrobium sediminis TaxID=2904603 RepID=UPI001E36FB58|nr:hypothetical protein [Ornithinimicrobium sediminis]MCE0485885.1 hypothetical protein [Ornithinimicrobium sediminis]
MTPMCICCGVHWCGQTTGPAGGRGQEGDGGHGEHIAMDPFELCRAVSGRAPAAGLLATQVPF